MSPSPQRGFGTILASSLLGHIAWELSQCEELQTKPLCWRAHVWLETYWAAWTFESPDTILGSDQAWIQPPQLTLSGDFPIKPDPSCWLWAAFVSSGCHHKAPWTRRLIQQKEIFLQVWRWGSEIRCHCGGFLGRACCLACKQFLLDCFFLGEKEGWRGREKEWEGIGREEWKAANKSQLSCFLLRTLILLEQGPSLMNSLDLNYFLIPNTVNHIWG